MFSLMEACKLALGQLEPYSAEGVAGDKALPLSDASSLSGCARGNAFLLFSWVFTSADRLHVPASPFPQASSSSLLWDCCGLGVQGVFLQQLFIISPFLKPALCTELWDLMQHKELYKLFSKISSIFSSLLSETGSGWVLAGQVQLLLQAPLQPMVNSLLCWKCSELSIAIAWCTPRPAPSCSAAPPGWHCLSPVSLHVHVPSRSPAAL